MADACDRCNRDGSKMAEERKIEAETESVTY
jgi:hypothetical protein